MRWFLFGVLMTFAVAGGSAAYANGQDDLKSAVAAVGASDWPKAARHADSAIKSGELKDAQLGIAHYIRGLASWGDAKLEDVLDDFSAATRLLPPTGELWVDAISNRIRVQMGLKRWRDAAAGFLTLAKERPAEAKAFDFSTLARLVWSLTDQDERATLNLLRTVKAIGYQPKSPGDSMDGMMGTYVRLLVQSGETTEALAELGKINDADTLVEARVDRRYAPLWTLPAFDEATKPSDIAKRELDEWEKRYRIYPTVTKVVVHYVVALRQAGAAEKAISVARETLSNSGALKSDRDDGDELWLRNELVYALKSIGKIDEMLTEVAPILAIDPAKDGNVVSQLINFGQILVELGRTGEGVEMAKRAWNHSSQLGKMFIQSIEVCANATTNKVLAEQTLADMRKTEKENYAAVTQGLLCLERSDDVASLVKKRLSQPESRAGVITAAQTYNAPPFVTPLRKILNERYQAVIARPDVRKKIEEYGRIETFPFNASYWGNL